MTYKACWITWPLLPQKSKNPSVVSFNKLCYNHLKEGGRVFDQCTELHKKIRRPRSSEEYLIHCKEWSYHRIYRA